MKICTKCNKEFPATLEYFCSDISKRDSLYSSCKNCNIKPRRSYKKKNRKELAEKSINYYYENKEAILERMRIKYRDDEDWRNNKKSIQLRKEYGITLEQYNTMLDEQDNRCKICGRHSDDSTKGLVIDHDHNTGKIRGLLCQQCNTGIGMFNDDIDILNLAIDYLRRQHGKENSKVSNNQGN